MRAMVKIFYLGNPNLQPWYDKAIDALPKNQDVAAYQKNKPLEDQIKDAEIIVEDGSTRITKQVVDHAKKVRFIQRYGTGMDHMDVNYVISKGIVVSNTPGQFSGVALAEHAILLMLGLAKRLPDWNETIQSRVIAVPCGDELHGRTLGIVGLGASGEHLAKLAKAFGMRVLAMDIRKMKPDKRKELGLDLFGGLESLDKILKESDYVSIHVPLTGRTRGMIGKREFGLMKKSARIINVARGPIIDEEALVDSLRSGRIAGAGLDVFPNEPIDPNHPILKMRNVLFSPHLAGVTVETAERRARVVGENVSKVIKGMTPLYQIAAAD